LTAAGHDVELVGPVLDVVDAVVTVVDAVVAVVEDVELVEPWSHHPWAEAGATVAVNEAATIDRVATSAVTAPMCRCRLPWLLSIISPPSY
jgi:hypothetical protein